MDRWKYRKKCHYFGADKSSSVHINGRYKNTLVLGEEPTQGSDNATITAKAKYSVSFTESGKQFVFFYLLL